MKAKRGGRAQGGARRSATKASRVSSHLRVPNRRYLFFGGKGGVGKTTAASAAALYLLDRAEEQERILLFSTDPAHSLSDSLGVRVGDRPVEIAKRGASRLTAFELDAGAALEKFKAEHRPVLQEIAERGTLLDESDINELLNLSLPGMDEVMALFELSELDRARSYTRIVVDTAPSGHTSRLLKLPEVFSHMVSALDRMAEKHRYMVAQFVRGGRAGRDHVDLFLSDLSERIERVRSMLFNKERASFTLVMIPEAMAFEETARYFEMLKKEGVPVTDLIVNRIEREHGDCEYCRSRAAGQQPWLRRISDKFQSFSQHHVPLQMEEVRGLDALRSFAQVVWEDTGENLTLRHDDAAKKKRADLKSGNYSLSTSARTNDYDHQNHLATTSGKANTNSNEFELEPRRLLIFGGKGGVGKTTAAAATALNIARSSVKSRVLIFSTDPAHSLSDSFDEPVGELRRGLAGLKNLDGMEIDPAARFEELKNRYRAWTDELFGSLAGGSRWEIKFDREAMRELVALAPPGIDEIAALAAISDLLEDGRYTTIVLDTAPTGHLVRFLELPEVALSWVRTFIKLLLKYSSVVRPGQVAEELIALSKSIKKVSALMTDAQACEFIGVAIPEQMSLEETVRLTESLARLKVPLKRLLINNVVPSLAASGCEFCAARRKSQEKRILDFQKRLKSISDIYIAPQHPFEIHGAERLSEHFASWQLLKRVAREQPKRSRKRRAVGKSLKRRANG